jgi:O-acetyl-ADP-ribose deacetylase (regulator of RNase III)
MFYTPRRGATVITYVQGNLFTSPAQTLVNTVNTVGVMGRGIARTFKRIYPEMFQEYQRLCEEHELTIGRLYLYKTTHKWVMNFPTKRHWRQPSRVEDVEAGLESFVARYADHGIASIAFPQLGCGNGGLDWEQQVRPLMERYLAALSIDVYIHVYAKGSLLPEHLDQKQMTAWLRSEPRSLPFSEAWADLSEAIVAGSSKGWSIADREEPTFRYQCDGDVSELAYSDLFGLWQRFRRYGFMTPADVSPDLKVPASAILDLLNSLPYVAEASVAPLPEAHVHRSASTQTLLADACAQGLRLVQPLFDAPATVPLLKPDEDATACRTSLTLKQSAFA